jgi:hypothetical protein
VLAISLCEYSILFHFFHFLLRSPYLFFTSFIFSGFTLASCGILLLQTLSEPPLPASATCQNQASRAFVKTWLYSTAHMRVHAAVSNWNAGKCQANESANSTQKTSTWAREQTAYSLSFRKSGPKAIIYNYIYIIPVILFQWSIVRIRTDNSQKLRPSFWKDHPDQYSDRAVALASQASTQTARLDLDTEASTCRQPGLPVASCMVKPSQGSVIMLRNNLRTDPETLAMVWPTRFCANTRRGIAWDSRHILTCFHTRKDTVTDVKALLETSCLYANTYETSNLFKLRRKQTLVTLRWTFPQRDLIQVWDANRITVITVVHRCQDVKKGSELPSCIKVERLQVEV